MKERPIPTEKYVLTPENTDSVLQKIGQAREQKGISGILIPQIDSLRRQAEILGDYNTATMLYQEKLLCAQHLIMENKRNPVKVARGISIIGFTISQMLEFQKSHKDKIDPVVAARSFRFLGRQSDILHRYKQSEKYYRQGLEFFKPLEHPSQRYQSLELHGFLAFSLLKQNKSGWFELTQETLTSFDNSPEGNWLNENDYYTWAVWKSGIEIRNSGAILDSKKFANQYKGDIEVWLKDADYILQMPDGDRERFGIRRQELDEVTQKLK